MSNTTDLCETCRNDPETCGMNPPGPTADCVRFEERLVATIRLPVSIKPLCAIMDNLIREHGRGLIVREEPKGRLRVELPKPNKEKLSHD